MTMLAAGPGHRAGRPMWLTIVFIALAAVLLFVAGFGVAWLLRGSSSGSADDGASPAPLPCTTVTVVPGNGLPKPGQVTTNVYNATDRAGLAAETAATLKKRGFGIGKIDNDPLGQKVRKPAEIRHGPKGLDSAMLMSFYIPGSVLVVDDRKDATIDTVLGRQFTDVESAAQVQKALTAPSPSPSGPGCPVQPGQATPSTPAASPAASPAPSGETSGPASPSPSAS